MITNPPLTLFISTFKSLCPTRGGWDCRVKDYTSTI